MTKRVVKLPKYGLFKRNEFDKKQIRKMKKAGYELMEETFSERIWIEK